MYVPKLYLRMGPSLLRVSWLLLPILRCQVFGSADLRTAQVTYVWGIVVAVLGFFIVYLVGFTLLPRLPTYGASLLRYLLIGRICVRSRLCSAFLS